MTGRRVDPVARRLARLRALVGFAVSMVLVVGCGSDGTDADDVPGIPIESGVPVESGVGVLAVGCGTSIDLASGVVVETPGLVVTVAHAIAGATRITIVDATGTSHDAIVVAFDPERDLAALTVAGLDARPLELTEVRLGDAHTLRWTRPDGVEAKPVDVTTRLAITIDDIYGRGAFRRGGLELAGVIDVGDSGGPVLSVDGGVMGIVYARSKQRGSTAFATDSSEIRILLDSISGDAVDNGTCR